MYLKKKYGEYNTKTENIFNGHLNNINLEEKKKKLNIGSKKLHPKAGEVATTMKLIRKIIF